MNLVGVQQHAAVTERGTYFPFRRRYFGPSYVVHEVALLSSLRTVKLGAFFPKAILLLRATYR